MLNILLETESTRVCVLQNVVHVHVLKSAERPGDLDSLEQAIDRGVRSQDGACGMLVTMAKFESSPTAERRQAAIAMLQRQAPHLHAVAIVLPNDGIKSTITRSMINTIFLASRMKTTKIFSDLDTAASWLVEKMADKVAALNNLQIAEDAKALVRAPKQSFAARLAHSRQHSAADSNS